MNSLSTDICYEIGVRQTYLHRLLQLVYYYSIKLLFTYVLLLLIIIVWNKLRYPPTQFSTFALL